MARRHFGGTCAARLIVTAGLGGMGGAQPLAVTMNGGVALVIEVDPQRIARRLATNYVDERRADLDDALARVDALAARRAWRARSRSKAMPPTCCPELVRRGVTPDVVTDQTSAHDALNGYVPPGLSLAEAGALRRRRARSDTCGARWQSMAVHVRAMLDLQRRGAVDVRLRQQHPRPGREGRRRRRVRHSRLRARIHPAALLRGQGAVPLGGALGRSGGHRTRPTTSRSRCSRTTTRCAAGSGSRASG